MKAMNFHCADADLQYDGDFPVTMPDRYEVENLMLPAGQWVD